LDSLDIFSTDDFIEITKISDDWFMRSRNFSTFDTRVNSCSQEKKILEQERRERQYENSE
jgi:hypothetical protein